MIKGFDPHRAHPDTVLELLEWHLSGGHGDEGYALMHKLTKALQEQCRVKLRTAAERDAAILQHVKTYDPDVLYQDGYSALARLLLEPFAEASGPPGAATKESKDTAAPGGATIPEPPEEAWDTGPCGCEEAEALKAELNRRGAECQELRDQLAKIRRLARSPGVQALYEEIDRE